MQLRLGTVSRPSPPGSPLALPDQAPAGPRRPSHQHGYDVIVVGAGVIGLACAYSLAASGLQPLLIDADVPGAGASWGNGGLIAFAPEIVAPVPGPGVVPRSLLWLIQRDSPLRLTANPSWDYLRWLGSFLSSCSREASAAGLDATLALNAETQQLFDDLRRDGLEFEMHQRGLLVVYGSRRAFELACKQLGKSAESDPALRVLSGTEALEMEPLLRSEACAGAIRYEAERQIRPDTLVNALVGKLGRMGVEIRSGCSCEEIIRDGAAITGIRIPDETISAQSYVLAAGTGIGALAKKVGVRIPLESGRGYSFDLPRDEFPLQVPLYLHDARLTLTPFRDFTRVVGMMELGARRATVRGGAIETMNRLGAAVFQHWPSECGRSAWAGLRPMTPDGLPVIGGVSGIPNLFIAGGHGMLGVTLSLRTGDALAACVRGDGEDPLLRPFSPNRFTRRRDPSTVAAPVPSEI